MINVCPLFQLTCVYGLISFSMRKQAAAMIFLYGFTGFVAIDFVKKVIQILKNHMFVTRRFVVLTLRSPRKAIVRKPQGHRSEAARASFGSRKGIVQKPQGHRSEAAL